MAHNSDNEWVSESGTARRLSIAQEPHSINEMGETRRTTAENTAHKREPALTGHPGTDPPEPQSKEPTDSADQQDAARQSLGRSVARARPVEAAKRVGATIKSIMMRLLGGM